jgi:hypothetical protein
MPGHDDQFEGRSAYVLVLGEFSIYVTIRAIAIRLFNVCTIKIVLGYDPAV